MVKGNVGRLVLCGGMTLAAALMMTTAVFGQDQGETGESDPAVTVDVVPSDGSDADGPPDIVIDDGYVVGGWPDDPVDDGSGDDGSGDDGTGDDGSGDDDWADDGSDEDWVDDGSGDDEWVDDGTGDDGTGDDWVDDGSGDDEWVDDGSDADGPVDDGEGVIYYLDGGPVLCADCEVGIADLPMEAYQMNAGTPLADVADAPVAAKPRRTKSHAVAAGGMAECLAEHPQLPWICEWQNGAGQ